ncbi:hypothetical protein ES705_11332 [subsurface metagenome]
MTASQDTKFATRIEQRRSATRARSNGVRQSGGRCPSVPCFPFFQTNLIDPISSGPSQGDLRIWMDPAAADLGDHRAWAISGPGWTLQLRTWAIIGPGRSLDLDGPCSCGPGRSSSLGDLRTDFKWLYLPSPVKR